MTRTDTAPPLAGSANRKPGRRIRLPAETGAAVGLAVSGHPGSAAGVASGALGTWRAMEALAPVGPVLSKEMFVQQRL